MTITPAQLQSHAPEGTTFLRYKQAWVLSGIECVRDESTNV
jgi:hypothetical protein